MIPASLTLSLCLLIFVFPPLYLPPHLLSASSYSIFSCLAPASEANSNGWSWEQQDYRVPGDQATGTPGVVTHPEWQAMDEAEA